MGEPSPGPSIPAGVHLAPAVCPPGVVVMTVISTTTAMTSEQARGLAAYLLQLADRGGSDG